MYVVLVCIYQLQKLVKTRESDSYYVDSHV